MMKYISSSYSPLMFQDVSVLKLQEQIPKEQFMEEIIDAYSCVKAEDVAKMLNVTQNKETIKARVDDVIYYVGCEQGTYKFFRIKVMPSQILDGYYCEEVL